MAERQSSYYPPLGQKKRARQSDDDAPDSTTSSHSHHTIPRDAHQQSDVDRKYFSSFPSAAGGGGGGAGGHQIAYGHDDVLSPPLVPPPSPGMEHHFLHQPPSLDHAASHRRTISASSDYAFSTPSLSTGTSATMSTSSSSDTFTSPPNQGTSPSMSSAAWYGDSSVGLGVSGMLGGNSMQTSPTLGSDHYALHPHHYNPYAPPSKAPPSSSAPLTTRVYIHPSSARSTGSSPSARSAGQGSPPLASGDVHTVMNQAKGVRAKDTSLPTSARSPTMSTSSPRQTFHSYSPSQQHQSMQMQSMPAPTIPLPVPPPGNYAQPETYRKGADLGLELGDFDMLDTLGTGTFGRVLLSRLRPSPNSRPAQTAPHYFAMKVLEKNTVVRLRQVEHLNSERSTLASVSGHPFVVNLFCTFQDERNLYLLLEYVQGGELFSHLRRAGRFSPDVARFYAANLVLTLEYLHARDIIYRDLKPENLLIDSTGYLKMTDFGFAKHVTDRTYTLCGTPEYLAPEIITATGHGKAADYWALGVLLFELLAGYPPFFADNPLEIYEKILTGKFAFPPHIDFVAKDLIKRLLTADLSKRLGNLKGGADDVKRHRWFEGVDWEAVERKHIRAPITPHTSTPGDTSNFERYPTASLGTLPGVVRAHHARQMGISVDSLEKGADPYGYLFPGF